MKKTLILCTLFVLSFTSFSQSIKRDASGNYVQIKDTTRGQKATLTGNTFTTSKGDVYPVFVSVNGKLFIVRTSKNGNQYKQYLKIDNK
jgi:hypothetical protein